MLKKRVAFKKWLVPVLALALFVGVAWSAMQKPSAPEVTFTTLAGDNIDLKSLRGKTVLINFWATDCPGCIKEMPMLAEMYTQYKDKQFELIAVAMPYDQHEQVVNYSKTQALPFPVTHDTDGRIVKAFGNVNLTPTAFLFDAEGKRLQKVIGDLDFNHLRALLDENSAHNHP